MTTLVTNTNREYATVTINGEEHRIRLAGTTDVPYFHGRDVCKALGYNKPLAALQTIERSDKNTLSMVISNHIQSASINNVPNMVGNDHSSDRFLGPKTFSQYEGQSIFISEKGLFFLINGRRNFKSKDDFKSQMNKVITDLKYKFNSGPMDIFSFMKGYDLTIDIQSDWFQDLWYPLTKFQGDLQVTLDRVKIRPIIVTQKLLEWMGYNSRREIDKQQGFIKLLNSLKLPYEEIGYNHPYALDYPCVQEEAKLIPSNNITRKKWICMDIRNFKKAVMSLSTKNADIIRDYYLNLEEVMIAYGEYTRNYLNERKEKLHQEELVRMTEQLAIKDKSHQEELAIKDKSYQEQLTIKDEQLAIKDKAIEARDRRILYIKNNPIHDRKLSVTEIIYFFLRTLTFRVESFKI